jgi:O-acetyl-ADP-ribose deacetylase (regulator of RNase III)
MITIVNGNILNCKESIICHQVNCKGVMGAGLAKQIRNRYPEVYTRYRNLSKALGDDALGWIQPVQVYDTQIEQARTIINIFGQKGYGYGPGQIQTDYHALKIGFQSVKNAFRFIPIAIPYKFGMRPSGWKMGNSI